MNKGSKIIYWVATTLLSFGMLASGLQQILHAKEMTDIMAHLGYPLYFSTILGIWKVLGVVVILMPGFRLAKEWAYAGLFFVMTGALASHLASGDYGIKDILGPVMQTVFILFSWYFRPADRKVALVNQ